MPSAASISLIFETILPQLPTVGLMIFGNPFFSNASSAESFENATVASGVATPAFCNSICVKSLFPAKIPVLRQLTTFVPCPSIAAVE